MRVTRIGVAALMAIAVAACERTSETATPTRGTASPQFVVIESQEFG